MCRGSEIRMANLGRLVVGTRLCRSLHRGHTLSRAIFDSAGDGEAKSFLNAEYMFRTNTERVLLHRRQNPIEYGAAGIVLSLPHSIARSSTLSTPGCVPSTSNRSASERSTWVREHPRHRQSYKHASIKSCR